MKIIDMLNKMANGEEVPKKIKWGAHTFELWEHTYIERDRVHKDKNWNYDFSDYSDLSSGFLNEEIEILDEVEIIEEKEMCHKCHKYPAEYNQTWCEFCLGISKEEKHI